MSFAVFAQRRGAMAADVEEGAQLAALVANEQRRHTADRVRRPCSRCRHLVDDARAHPVTPEHRVALASVKLRRAVRGSGKGPRFSDSGWVRDVAECYAPRLRAVQL